MAEGKSAYAALADGLVKALSGAFIFIAGYLLKSGEDEKEALRAKIKELQLAAEVRRRGADVGERERLRTTFQDKG